MVSVVYSNWNWAKIYAFQSQNDLLRGLSLFVEYWLGLTTVSRLLAVVSALSLGEQRGFTSLVLGDLMLCMLLAVFALAVRASVA